jgi:hypothetical protein
MKKIFLFLLVLTCTIISASAQKVAGTVRGYLQDSVSSAALSDATVSIIRSRDSMLISFTLSNDKGFFEIRNIEPGDYQLISSFQGLQTYKKRFSITAEKPVVDMNTIKMSRFYKTMDEIVIKDDAPVKVKGDTIAYNADAFKTKPNATVEDLLKKLPGVQVDKDGTVKAQGENVQKVYVDGKEFFGTDPKLATKNLNADMVDQIEVYDDMSEQAKFNKIDDGSRTKAINLKLKKEKKKGIFGKVYAGYGNNDRYDAGITTNFFKGATQTSIIAKSNNTNNIGFTVSDMIGMFSTNGNMGGMMNSGMGGLMTGGGGLNVVRAGGFGGFSGGLGGLNLGSTGSGITRSSQAGINYRDTWSKSFDVNGSYFFNSAGTNNLKNSYKQTLYSDSTGLTDETVLSKINNYNHRFNMNMIFSIDSFNSLIYSPNLSYQQSESFADDSISSAVQKNSSVYTANRSHNMTNSTGDGFTWNNNLIWRRKFRRPGRTLSINFNNSWGENDRDRINAITSRFFDEGGIKYNEFSNNNLNTTASKTNNYTVTASYTEPIARDKIMEINYSHGNNRSNSDWRTNDFNTATGKYDLVVDSLTNNFHNQNVFDRLGTNFRVVKKKYNYQLGFAVQQTVLESENLTKKSLVKQKYNNIFPTASFNYQFQRSRSLRFNYRGRSSQPGITQLQDVEDRTKYPYIYRGNPNLKQEFSNNFILSYNYFDIVKFSNLFAFISFNNTMNKITNSREDLGGIVQLTQPVNLNGYFNVNGNFNMGFPIKKLKGGNFNTTTRISYNRDVSLINRAKNYTKNLTIGEDLRLNYNYKDKLDMGLTASLNYNSVNNTMQKAGNSSYYTHTYSADISLNLPWGFILASDFDYTFNTGRTNGFNQNYALWNGSMAKQLFKNKRGEIKASVFDILNQNTNISRNIYDNNIEDVRNTTLQRFFMLTFTYNINRMGGKTMPAMLERATKGIRITQ